MTPLAPKLVLTGSDVDEWRDSSVSGADFEDASSKPSVTASDNDFNGKPSVTFTPTNRMALMVPGALDGSGGDHTFILVHKSATANDGASHVIFATGTSPYGSPDHIAFFWGFGGPNQLGGQFGGGVSRVTTSTQTTATRYDRWVFDDDAATLEVFENGTSAGAASYSATNTLKSGTKANIGADVSDIRHYSGKIALMLYWNRKLSVRSIEAAIAKEYGI